MWTRLLRDYDFHQVDYVRALIKITNICQYYSYFFIICNEQLKKDNLGIFSLFQLSALKCLQTKGETKWVQCNDVK